VFRDAFVDGKPVITHFHGGQSLPGQILHGTVAAGMVAGGMVGASALRRPDKYINTESSNASLSQGQGQATKTSAGAAAISISESSSKNKNVNEVSPGVIQQGGCRGNCGGGNNGNPHNDN